MKKFFITLALVALVFTPFMAEAALVNCQNNCTLMHALELVVNIINLAIQFAGFIVVIRIMQGGYTIMTASMGGSAETYENGKKIITNALIGFILVLASYVLVNIAWNLLFPGTFGNTWMQPWGGGTQ